MVVVRWWWWVSDFCWIQILILWICSDSEHLVIPLVCMKVFSAIMELSQETKKSWIPILKKKQKKKPVGPPQLLFGIYLLSFFFSFFFVLHKV